MRRLILGAALAALSLSSASAEQMIIAGQNDWMGIAILPKNTFHGGTILYLNTLEVYKRPIRGVDFAIRRDLVNCKARTYKQGSFVGYNLRGEEIYKSLEEKDWVTLKSSPIEVAALGECLGVKGEPIEAGYIEAVMAFREGR